MPVEMRLADPAWSTPITAAGFDPAAAGIVRAVGSVLVSSPSVTASDGMPFISAETGILVAQGDRLGIAVPDAKRIVVVSYDRHGAELNVGDTGMFKLVWAQRSYGIVFTDTDANSPEGREFGDTLLRYIESGAVPPVAVRLSAIDFNTLLRSDASTADRTRVLSEFAGTVRTRLHDAAASAGEGTDALAERAGQLLGEVVERLPIRRSEELLAVYGAQASVRAERVVGDAVTLARWLWMAAKAIPAPEPVVHTAKVVLHSAIEIRMIGELHEAHREPDLDAVATPLPRVLSTWVTGTPGTVDWSVSSTASMLVGQVRRVLGELRGHDGRIKGLMNRGREGGEIVQSLGLRIDGLLRQPAAS